MALPNVRDAGSAAEVCPAGRETRAMESLLEINNLTVSYRDSAGVEFRAVEGVSFQIPAGETLGLMGESGCGKSSITLAALGLLSDENARVSGSVIFRGQNLLRMRERELRQVRGGSISLVHQDAAIALSPVMRVGVQIAEVVRAHKRWTWHKCCEEAHSILARVGLEPTSRIFAAYPHQLSGGQLQRIVLAQALVCGPALVIADEPTASLDARTQSEFIALLRDLKQRSGISLLLISHTPEIQASLAGRLVVMRAGQIVESGDFGQLYANPADSYTRALLRRPTADARDFAAGKRIAAEQIAR
jgi:ABC-type glutathione transport system ATPase component